MKSRHFVYDLIQDTSSLPQPNLSIILKEFVPGYGSKGDTLTLRSNEAYKKFLVPGLAVYATPENVKKYETYKITTTEPEHSSLYSERTVSRLSQMVLEITMNKTQPWKLEPWHVRTSFRKSGFIVPEYAIEMPPMEIKGPDLSLQEKEFYVTVTVNNKEKVNVRCRIHHWATGLERLPWKEFHWKLPAEPLIPEQAEVLEQIPLPK
ncbi:39S ribosomal protein L9, mitochondrial [Eumeta japonica]|uniref:Large ribosomal subunit protein bL9m n=1 Tax=Eumeta variegata TaxID=151549 RepID=A0A4C1WGP8_EUMVA|nr:39S ribosomal protein L9, mitochondrial [Eumeta japonica]